MSLFDDFQQWQIIENPEHTRNYYHILKKKKETLEEKAAREKAERKALSKKMKAELSPEEFKVRRRKTYYQIQKKQRQKDELARYYRKKKAEEAMLDEIYKELYDTIPEPIDLDRFYTEVYREDDTDRDWKFRIYRWCTRLRNVNPSKWEAITHPVRVYWRSWILQIFRSLWAEQKKAYEYIKPHLDEVSIKDFSLSPTPLAVSRPSRAVWGKMRELVNTSGLGKNQLCSVTSALLRDKYIASEIYLWRVSFLVGDVIITQAGNIFRPVLEHWLPWLNSGTVNELHQKRLDWFARKCSDLPIYILRDAYLFKYQINERETYFYIVPT